MNNHFDFIFNNEHIFAIPDNMGRPWFLAKDIARIFNYNRIYDMIRICQENELIRINGITGQIVSNNFYNINFPIFQDLAENEQGAHCAPCSNYSIPGIIRTSPIVTLINEPGVYRIIFSSRNHNKAIEFQNWVFNEVLPSIRATGSYMDDAIREYLINNPSVIDEYLLEQEAIGEMWEAYDEEDRIWTENMLRTEYIFDNPYGKPEELLDYE